MCVRSALCTVSGRLVNQALIQKISWPWPNSSWLTRWKVADILTWRCSTSNLWNTSECKKQRKERNYHYFSRKRTQPDSVSSSSVSWVYLKKKWCAWVKNSSLSSYAVMLTIIFTIARHESPTPLLKGRFFSQTQPECPEWCHLCARTTQKANAS